MCQIAQPHWFGFAMAEVEPRRWVDFAGSALQLGVGNGPATRNGYQRGQMVATYMGARAPYIGVCRVAMVLHQTSQSSPSAPKQVPGLYILKAILVACIV